MLDFLAAYPTPLQWITCRYDLFKSGWSPTEQTCFMTHPEFPNRQRADNAWDISAAWFFTKNPDRYQTLPQSIRGRQKRSYKKRERGK